MLGIVLMAVAASLPPCGGSGLKWFQAAIASGFAASPSMRREWIEITSCLGHEAAYHRLPPCGGSGLK